MNKKILAFILIFLLLFVSACSSSEILTGETTDVNTEQKQSSYLESDSDTEVQETINEYQEYLNSVSPSYTLLGSTTPGFVGRWFEKKISGVNHMITLNDGSSFYFLTDGAKSFDVEFTLITEQTPYFAYSIDGSSPIRQSITSPTVELPNQGKHIVRIFADGMWAYEGKWDYEKGFAFKQVSVDEGVLWGIMPRSKIIAFYGDSITEGVAALGKGNSNEVNSATSAYPYFCCEALGAVSYNVGYSSSGVCKSGSFKPFITAIDSISSKTRVNDSFKPDVIVINHGTNDVSYGKQEFIMSLKKALDRLIEKYHDTPIIYMIPFGQYRAADIRATIGLYMGKVDITIIETNGWGIQLTDNYHPTAQGAKVAGEKLASAIEAKLGKDFFIVG